jgi:hypothetical protein
MVGIAGWLGLLICWLPHGHAGMLGLVSLMAGWACLLAATWMAGWLAGCAYWISGCLCECSCWWSVCVGWDCWLSGWLDDLDGLWLFGWLSCLARLMALLAAWLAGCLCLLADWLAWLTGPLSGQALLAGWLAGSDCWLPDWLNLLPGQMNCFLTELALFVAV